MKLYPLVIHDCSQCPNFEDVDNFGLGDDSYYICGKTKEVICTDEDEQEYFRKIYEYENDAEQLTLFPLEKPETPFKIPDSCPLDDYEETNSKETDGKRPT